MLTKVDVDFTYKGKSIKDNRWVIGSLLALGKRRFIVPKDDLPDDIINSEVGSVIYSTILVDYCEVDPATVAIFTPYKDIEGNQICTGDILEDTADGCREVVKLEYGYFVPFGRFCARSGFLYSEKDWRIVGNIYDNPGGAR